MPEGARLDRRPVVARGLAHEVEPPDRPRARGVEEVAVAADLVGPLEAPIEFAAAIVVEERRSRAAPREMAFFEPEHENRVEAARACASQVEYRHAARLTGRRSRHFEAAERVEQLVATELAARPLERRDLLEELAHGGIGAQVETRLVARGR